MSRPKTKTKALDERIQLSLRELKKQGYWQDGRSGWYAWHNGVYSLAKVYLRVILDEASTEASGWLLLHYDLVGGPVQQSFQLIQRKSNLGRGGGIWYLVCPQTRRLCRTLYFDALSFVSRWAIQGALYRDQQVSKSDREFRRGLRRLRQLQQFIVQTTDWLGQPRSKRTYRGKLTQSMQRYLKLKAAFDPSQQEP